MCYDKHIFLCINERDNNRDCCAKRGSKPLLDYLKTKIKMLDEKKKIRVSSAGCLGRCSEGPVLVIYPDGVWYDCESRQDIDEIVQEHIINKQIVTRLLLSNV
ncbi:MAG: (2Fe-2S) ferredoxin domain-containing protein [Pseudomonadota bacterium]